MTKKLLLIGGSGFIGSNLVRKIDLAKYDLTVSYVGEAPKFDKRVKLEKLDVLKRQDFEKTIKNKDIIIYLAGQISDNKDYFYSLNTQGAINFFESLLELPKKPKVILTSTTFVYGETDNASELDFVNPKDEYGIVKHLAERIFELYSKNHHVPVCILRLSNVYGPGKGMGVISRFVECIKCNKPLIMDNNGIHQRDFIHIDDVSDAIIKTLAFDFRGFEIINISTAKSCEVAEVAETLKKFNKNLIINSVDNENAVVLRNCASNAKAREVLGFEPKISLEEGLKRLLS